MSRLDDMFKEKADATHIRAAEVMQELRWDAAASGRDTADMRSHAQKYGMSHTT